MPIFEFKCNRCGHIYEELVLSGDDGVVKCPACKSKKVSRLISRTGAIRKRTGTSGGSTASCAGGAFT